MGRFDKHLNVTSTNKALQREGRVEKHEGRARKEEGERVPPRFSLARSLATKFPCLAFPFQHLQPRWLETIKLFYHHIHQFQLIDINFNPLILNPQSVTKRIVL